MVLKEVCRVNWQNYNIRNDKGDNSRYQKTILPVHNHVKRNWRFRHLCAKNLESEEESIFVLSCRSKSSSCCCIDLCNLFPLRPFHFDKHALGNALAALDGNGIFADVIDLHHYFILRSAKVLINNANTMREDQCFFSREGGTGSKKKRVSFRNFDDDIARNKADFLRFNDGFLPCVQIKGHRAFA